MLFFFFWVTTKNERVALRRRAYNRCRGGGSRQAVRGTEEELKKKKKKKMDEKRKKIEEEDDTGSYRYLVPVQARRYRTKGGERERTQGKWWSSYLAPRRRLLRGVSGVFMFILLQLVCHRSPPSYYNIIPTKLGLGLSLTLTWFLVRLLNKEKLEFRTNQTARCTHPSFFFTFYSCQFLVS